MKVISEKFGSMDNNCSLIIDEKQINPPWWIAQNSVKNL